MLPLKRISSEMERAEKEEVELEVETTESQDFDRLLNVIPSYCSAHLNPFSFFNKYGCKIRSGFNASHS